MKEIVKQPKKEIEEFRCNQCLCKYKSNEYEVYVKRDIHQDIRVMEDTCPNCKGECRIQIIDNLIPNYDD